MNIEYDLMPHNRAGLNAKLDALAPTIIWHVSVKPKKSKRSIDQNSRLWGHVYKTLAEHLGIDAEEVHQLMGYKYLRYQKSVNGIVQEFIKSTTKLDTKEMAEYQDNIGRWASEIGCWIE
jgi:hypothetical protein